MSVAEYLEYAVTGGFRTVKHVRDPPYHYI